MSEFFCEAASGKLPACVKAGYSFVDVRDAAQMIVAACTRGVSGQSYLAAGPTVSMMKLAVMAARISHTRPVALELPLDVVLAVTPVTALCYRLNGKSRCLLPLPYRHWKVTRTLMCQSLWKTWDFPAVP